MFGRLLLLLSLSMSFLVLSACTSMPAPPQAPGAVQAHSDSFFNRLSNMERGEPEAVADRTVKDQPPADPSAPLSRSPVLDPHAVGPMDVPLPEVVAGDQEIRAIGYGALSRGRFVCQRVADMAARAALAREVRTLVAEHAVDHVRERSNKAVEQDLDVTREERAEAALQGTRIIDRREDPAAGTCSSMAVVLRNHVLAVEHPSR
jgi:hypothetical protein